MHANSSLRLETRALMAVLAFVVVDAVAQTPAFLPGDVYIYTGAHSNVPPDPGAQLIRVDPRTGAWEIARIFPGGGGGLITFDSYRNALVFGVVEGGMRSLYAMEADGDLTLLKYNSSDWRQFAPSGDGRIFFKALNNYTWYQDRSLALHPILNEAGTSPVDDVAVVDLQTNPDYLGWETMTYDKDTNSVFLAARYSGTSVRPLMHVGVTKLPLTEDGSRLRSAPVTTFFREGIGDGPIKHMGPGPRGSILIVTVSVRLDLIDPVNMTVSSFARTIPGDPTYGGDYVRNGVYSAASNSAVNLRWEIRSLILWDRIRQQWNTTPTQLWCDVLNSIQEGQTGNMQTLVNFTQNSPTWPFGIELGGNPMMVAIPPPSDVTAPAVAIQSPADGLVTRDASLLVQATVTDDSPTTVASTPAGVAPPALPALGGTVSGYVDAQGPDGPFTIAVSATDAAGNVGGNSVTVVLDRTAPTVQVPTPADGTVFGMSPVTFSIQVADANSTTAVFGQQSLPIPAIPAGGGSVSAEVPVTEGLNEVPVTVTDAAGNTTIVRRFVILDSSAPLVTIETPVTGSAFGVGQARISVRATVDDLTATTVSSTPAGVAGLLPPGGGIALGDLDLVEGLNTITVTATDAANVVGSASVTVVLDTTPPSVSITSPASGAWVRAGIDFHAAAQDVLPGTGIARVEFLVDGNPLGAPDTAEPFEVIGGLDTMLLADGRHTLTAMAIDGKGNSRSVQIEILVDNTPPSVTITAPMSTGIVFGTTPFLVQAQDGGSGVVAIEQRVGSLLPTTDASSTYATPTASATVSGAEDTTRWPNGLLSFSAWATDAAGNVAEPVLVSATVDNSAPPMPLLTPGDGQKVKGTIQIVATSDAALFQSVEIKIDGVSIGTSTTSPFTLPFDTLTMMDGPLTVQAVVTGINQMVSTATARLTIDNMSFRLTPSTFNLTSRGGANGVKAHMQGLNVALLFPPAAHGVALLVPGGSPVPVTPDSTLPQFRFSRQDLVNAIRAGIAADLIQPGGQVQVVMIADGGRVIGSDVLRLVGR